MASRIGLWMLRLAVPAVLLAGLVLGGRVPLGEAPADGVLRLAWRFVSAPVEHCRPYTAGEKASLPEHMQAGQHCERSLLAYRLQVAVDGETRLDKRLQPPGIHADRPLYAQEHLPLPPGQHQVRIRFVPDTPPQGAASGTGGDDGNAAADRRKALQAARHFALEQSVRICAGRVALVTLNDPGGESARLALTANGCDGGSARRG